MRVDWSLVCVVVVSYQEYSLTHIHMHADFFFMRRANGNVYIHT